MGVEIERKFLVLGRPWPSTDSGKVYSQGYLNTDAERTVRVRTMGADAALTIKGKVEGMTRLEFEYIIPADEAKQLLALCHSPLIEKTRRIIDYGGLRWEVDEFHGLNEGLIVAECELESEDQIIIKPNWIGREVTGDVRYYNSNLVARPFSTWK